MTVDRELVTRKLLLITQDLDAVGLLATEPLSTFLASRVDQAVAERLLERMIGRMIDVNYHLITEGGQPPPPDGAGVPGQGQKPNRDDGGLAEAGRNIARLRKPLIYIQKFIEQPLLPRKRAMTGR